MESVLIAFACSTPEPTFVAVFAKAVLCFDLCGISSIYQWQLAHIVMLTLVGEGTSLRPQELSLQRSKVKSLASWGSPKRREVLCVNSVFTCSDR